MELPGQHKDPPLEIEGCGSPMLCTICSSEVRYVDNMLVCVEGHAFEHEMEVSEHAGTGVLQSSMRDRRSQHRHVQKKRLPQKYARLVVFTALFFTAQEFFGLKTDLLFRLHMATMVHRDRNIVSDHGIVSAPALYALLYLTKRHELEQSYRTVFAHEYMRYLRFFPYEEHLGAFSSKLARGTSLKRGPLRLARYSELVLLVHNSISRMNDIGTQENTGQEHKDAIKKIAEAQKKDMRLFFAYLDEILGDLSIPKTPELVFYFKKFVYANKLGGIIFVPEVEICTFLYEYLLRFGPEIDYRRALEEMHSRYDLLDRECYLEGKVRELISKHKSTNSPAMHAISQFNGAGTYDNVKDFISDYLGVTPGKFDSLRRRTLEVVNDTIERVRYTE